VVHCKVYTHQTNQLQKYSYLLEMNTVHIRNKRIFLAFWVSEWYLSWWYSIFLTRRTKGTKWTGRFLLQGDILQTLNLLFSYNRYWVNLLISLLHHILSRFLILYARIKAMHHVQGRGGLYQKSEFNSEYMKCIIFTYEGPK
jgi:hypothetical protein